MTPAVDILVVGAGLTGLAIAVQAMVTPDQRVTWKTGERRESLRVQPQSSINW